ncbi:MAG: heavy metal translocating P-type ATPase [Thermonemataceae bacterium]
MNATSSFVEPTVKCHHCGDDCPAQPLTIEDKHFCCIGCQTVYEILQANDLCTYYNLDEKPGISLKGKKLGDQYAYLEEEAVLQQLLLYQDENYAKVSLYIPAVHCSSCVWLLENFAHLVEGVQEARLNFVKKELTLAYDPSETNLRAIVELLATLGYEPLINLAVTEKKEKKSTYNRRVLLQIGVTGFCMGNIMLLSFPEYFHLDVQHLVDRQYQQFFLWLNALLALPIYFFGAADYLKGAYRSIRENWKKHTRELSVDIPIALGITALFVRSWVDTLQGQAGYWDSLAGLVFFLLLGKWMQTLTFNYLSFERSYKSYFPLAIKIQEKDEERYIPINDLQPSQQVIVHHQELIPADALLMSEKAYIDYSFVTGEATPVTKKKGDYIYAGGRQVGERITLLVQKPTSQSYLTQLWNHQAFGKEMSTVPTYIAAQFSKYFTYITLLIAFTVAAYWAFADPSLMWIATTAVLMVACPCALTLSMPFTMRAVMAVFGKQKLYVKNQNVIQHLNEIDTIVFDKTGTLTETSASAVTYEGIPLSEEEYQLVKSLTIQSTHPLSKKIATALASKVVEVNTFKVYPGQGIEGKVKGRWLRIGKASFVGQEAYTPSKMTAEVHVSINREYKGYFKIEARYRPAIAQSLNQLKSTYDLYLLSGDNEAAQPALESYFTEMHFHQQPLDKLQFIEQLQKEGKKVLMVGDGLNDAGALQQANVGLAIAEDAHTFSPACDAIIEANHFQQLTAFLKFSKTSTQIVKLSFLLSLVYNAFGIGWAATGQLSPVLAAIFMPFSSMSVVVVAVAATLFLAQYYFKHKPNGNYPTQRK